MVGCDPYIESFLLKTESLALAKMIVPPIPSSISAMATNIKYLERLCHKKYEGLVKNMTNLVLYPFFHLSYSNVNYKSTKGMTQSRDFEGFTTSVFPH